MDIRSTVIRVVEECAPEEVFIAESYDPDVRTTASGGPLGFGGVLEVAVLTPVIWKIVEEIVGKFLKQFSDEVVKDMAHAAAKRLAKTLGMEDDAQPQGSENLDKLTLRVEEKLRDAGVGEAKRLPLAKSISYECLNERNHAQ